MRIEHWATANYLGYIAALNMIREKSTPVQLIPFFWTRHWEKSLQYTGYAKDPEDIIVQGDPSKQTFLAYYVKNGKVDGELTNINLILNLYKSIKNNKFILIK